MRYSARLRPDGVGGPAPELTRTGFFGKSGDAPPAGRCRFSRGAEARGGRLSPPLRLRREVPATAMRTRVRAPLAAVPPPSQVAVEPDAPKGPLGAGGGAVADLLLAALHSPQRPIGTTECGRETLRLRVLSTQSSAPWKRRVPPRPVAGHSDGGAAVQCRLHEQQHELPTEFRPAMASRSSPRQSGVLVGRRLLSRNRL